MLQNTKSIYKNQLYFSTLTTDYIEKKKKENNPIHNSIKKRGKSYRQKTMKH